MRDRSRIAVTLASALLLGVSAYGRAFAVKHPGALQVLWDASGLLAPVLAVIGVFVVYRWWALLPAIAPVAVTVYLYNLTDYEPPWRDEAVGTSFSEDPLVFALFTAMAILVHVAVLAVGLLLRAAWEWWRSRRDQASAPHAV